MLNDQLFSTDEIWEQDMSSDMKIGLSHSGYHKVDLRCGADAFLVNVTLDHDFEGIVYTRGSFSNKKLPCFKSYNKRAVLDDERVLIALKIPFSKCQTTMASISMPDNCIFPQKMYVIDRVLRFQDVAESRYVNTLILQHDQDLIMPGDAAFSLECSFTPEYKLAIDLSTAEEPQFMSKITLVDADPSSESAIKGPSVHSATDNVSFVPVKDEL